jgi:2-octaprenyl-6-methoxyphenol hydroxylase
MTNAPAVAGTHLTTTVGEPPFDFDVTIVGAGPVGLAIAAWLARRSATQALSIALIDAREPESAASDPRAIAVSHGSRMLLEPLTAWPADATAIKRIHVSQRGHFGRTLIEHDEHGLPALGYVVRYGSIVNALARAVRTTRVSWLTSTLALPPVSAHDSVTLPIENAQGKRGLRTRILVNAEGGLYQHQKRHPASSNFAHPDGKPASNTRDYKQTALIGTVRVGTPQPHVAWERFTPEGPIALLPLGSARNADYSLVWCSAPSEAARRARLADAEFLAELGIAFGSRMGRFEAITGRASFPLGLNAVDAIVKGRVAAVGNAAQTLHPVAGQGLNLGLRDAHALADALCEYGPTPLALASFGARRALDRRLTIGLTDTLARLFTIDFAPLATLRGLVLSGLELMPAAKTALARQLIFGQRR